MKDRATTSVVAFACVVFLHFCTFAFLGEAATIFVSDSSNGRPRLAAACCQLMRRGKARIAAQNLIIGFLLLASPKIC